MSTAKTRGPYRVGLPSKRGCWTCRDRKVSCDQGRPECQNCTSLGRKCKGYGLRLSWPENGSRRNIQYTVKNTDITSNRSKHIHFINTLTEHVELLYMQDPKSIGKLSLHTRCIFPLVNLENARPSVGDEHHLITFFMTTVMESIAPIRTDGTKLWKLLFQLSFSDDSPASMAVLRAMLSLASLYRYGHGEEALTLKVAAIKSLRASMDGRVTGTTEIYQHTAVGMLLCAFEVFIPSESSFQWPLYVSGAKTMLHHICDGGHSKLMEVDQLVLWVHYHDILGKFASKHWKTKSAENASMFQVPGMASSLVSSIANDQVLGIFGCSLEMINLISRMTSIQSTNDIAESSRFAERETLDSIEYDLWTLDQDTTQLVGTVSTAEVKHGSRISQLYRLAGLIYLERVLKPSPTNGRLERWSAEAFDILRQLDICERPFPLFFVACEATTDEEREVVISLLKRTHKRSNQRRLHLIEHMIQSMWVQNDLVSDMGDRNYVDALNTTMSSSQLLPTLA